MAVLLLSPLFQLVVLLLASFTYGRVPNDFQPLTTSSSVPVTGIQPTNIQGPTHDASNDSSTFITDSPIRRRSPPKTILHPAVSPDIDLHDHNHFRPQQKLSLYYAQPAQNTTSNGVQSAFVDMAFVYPTVALEHCGFVTGVSCSATTIKIKVADSAAIDMTQHWPTGDFVLTGAGYKGCGPNGATSVESRFWILVSAFIVDHGSNEITCDIDYQSLKEVVTDFDISFGSQQSTTSATALSMTESSTKTVLARSATGPTTLVTHTHTHTSSHSHIKSHSKTTSTSSTSSTSSSSPTSTVVPISDPADFDVNLDVALGYLDPTAANFYSLILPGVDTSGLTGLSRRDLLFKRGFLSKIGSKLASVAKSIPIPAAVKKVVKAATTIVAKAISVVASIIPPLNITPINEVYPISLSAAEFGISPVSTYFGLGTPVYVDGGIGVYCVDCGFAGSMTVVGQLSASITKGITKAVITVNGPLQFGFNVALVASYSYSKTFEKQLGVIPLTPFSIPDIVSIGPELTFGVGLNVGFQATGGVLAGITVNWNDIDVVVDLIHYSGSSVSGLLPNSVTKTMLLQGEVDVTGEAYALFGLDFGIDILDGKFEISGGFEDKPSLELDLTIKDSLSLKRDVEDSVLEVRDCQGVDVSLTFMNELSGDFKAGSYSTEIGINTVSIPITDYCYSFAQPTSTTSSSPPSATTVSTSYPVYVTVTEGGAPSTITTWALTTLATNVTDTVTSLVPTTYTATEDVTITTSYPYTVVTTIISDITTTQTQWFTSTYTTTAVPTSSSATTSTTSATPSATAACQPGTQAVANGGFDLPFNPDYSTPDWTFDPDSSVYSVGFSVSSPNTLTWNGAQWTSEAFFASQTLTLCPGSSYSFSMYYNVQYKTSPCQIEALLDGTIFATSPVLNYDFSGPRPFDLFAGSVVATAGTQTLTLRPTCPPGTVFNIFLDNVSLVLGPGVAEPLVIQGQ